MDNYVGKRLDGRYEVQEIVGVGGMSVVYKAYDNVDDRIVAVKILKDEFLSNDDFKRRFKNESKAIALLSHPNIVKVYDVNFGEKLQYIVMEYIDGITLKEYINKQGAITWNDALFFMTQILKAVQHAHDKGIVHRDIKPQNIILLPSGNIKVTDFGIARFSRSDTKTLTEEAIGSVHYIAPEQAKGEFTDEKADIYSLGVVLYEMLSGDVPFEAESAVSVALMQLQADAKKLTDINPDIPLGLEQICIRAMQKNPLDRYQTATEMLLDIEEIVKNPQTTFNYATPKQDSNPTKIIAKGEIPKGDTGSQTPPYIAEPVYEDPDRKKKIITAVIIGLIVLATAVVLLIMSITNGMHKETYALENFVGSSWDEVYEASQNGVYKYKLVPEYEKTDKELPGTVIGQTPDAGTKVQEGSEVILTVAAAEDGITIPNVFGYTQSQAKTVLEKAGIININFVTVNSENVEEGKVVYTDPKANTPVEADKEVTVYVSVGPSTTVIETVKVPDVYGLNKNGARAFLEKYGFTNISFVTQDSTMPKDTVMSQSPSPGAEAQVTDSIKLVISSGITTTTTEKQLKATVSIKLPTVINKDGKTVKDTIIVSVDGAQNTKKTVTLDGSSYSVSVPGEKGKQKTISITLDKLGEKEQVLFKGEKDETLTVDFTSASKNDTTTTTTTAEAPPEEPSNEDTP